MQAQVVYDLLTLESYKIRNEYTEGNVLNIVENQTFDEERALYHLVDTEVKNCTFAGPADGESALKEARNISVVDSKFCLRYPFWHVRGFRLTGSSMDEGTRAPIWYSYDGELDNSLVSGIKCLRECENIVIRNCKIVSDEFGWRCKDLTIEDSEMESVYYLFESKNVNIRKLTMKGKYSFQYMENVLIEDSVLDTKDAFWHSKNVTVKNSILKGEYLAWFSESLTLIDCKIIGTQPLCYCKDLKLINCTMEDTDLAFEYSDVEADIKGHIVSVKNPKSGKIMADSIGDIIFEDAVMDTNGQVIIR